MFLFCACQLQAHDMSDSEQGGSFSSSSGMSPWSAASYRSQPGELLRAADSTGNSEAQDTGTDEPSDTPNPVPENESDSSGAEDGSEAVAESDDIFEDQGPPAAPRQHHSRSFDVTMLVSQCMKVYPTYALCTSFEVPETRRCQAMLT